MAVADAAHTAEFGKFIDLIGARVGPVHERLRLLLLVGIVVRIRKQSIVLVRLRRHRVGEACDVFAFRARGILEYLRDKLGRVGRFPVQILQ